MPSLREIVAYLCYHYPHKSELSKARLTKMVYLADWSAALSQRRTLSKIDWFYNHYGPYVTDVEDLARRDSEFKLEWTRNANGAGKELVSYSGPPPELDPRDRDILDEVINATKALYWNQFIEMVYSTFPVVTGEKGQPMDLLSDAQALHAMLDTPDP